MIDRAHAEALLAARKSRQAQVSTADRIAELATRLRAFFYPGQAKFFRSPAKRKATKKTRRSGATAGGCRELIARAIEHPGFRATYITGTLKDARERAWENDTQSGFVDIVRQYGKRDLEAAIETHDLCGVTVVVRTGDLELVFSNGSKIDLFGADDERAVERLRGLAKHVFWVDEAQDFRFLDRLYKAVIVAAMTDYEGECWVTGTPGKDCAGMFFEITRDEGEPLAGWEVHRIAVVDNPFFGAVVWKGGEWFVVDNVGNESGPFPDEAAAEDEAKRVRWERTAGAAIRDNHWAEDDPDLLREWYARWVMADARFVYALHAVPEHDIVYAPLRVGLDGLPDIAAACDDLPAWADDREYFMALGADLGTRDAFAYVLWAWSQADPCLYEVCSWKRTGLDYDEMAQHLIAVRGQVAVSMVVADAGGGGKPAVMGWSKKWMARYALPITEADKKPGYKPIAIKQLNNDIRHGTIKLRKDSPLMLEWRVHRWSPLRGVRGGEIEDPKTPNHCADAGLYAHMHSYHHRYREPATKPVAGTPAWVLQEERELESTAIDKDDRRGPYGRYW